MMRKAFIYIYYLFLLPILLCSCDFNSNRGTTVLEVIYPSGYARDCYNRDKEAPIEGTSFHLVAEELEVDTKSRGRHSMATIPARISTFIKGRKS